MAIVLKQERRPLPIGAIATVVLVAGISLFALYYLFINKPEVVDIVIPSPIRQITEIARTSFNPEELVQNPAFTRLKVYTGTPEIPEGSMGRTNPFAP